MTFSGKFLDFVSKEKIFSKKDRLLVAVSGGLDSVVLASLCAAGEFDFLIAHCNFQLRGEESERDEAFVRRMGERYAVPVYVQKFDTLKFAEENKLSIQVAARHLRYTWFNQLVDGKWRAQPLVSASDPAEKVADLLLTAHHGDDNIETTAMNFFKGTGITGLRAMLPKHGKICRPLLFARRTELLAYAEASGLEWVEDSSNSSEKYSRNKFRHSVLPLIEEIYPKAGENILNNIDRFRDIEILYRQRIDAIISKLVVKTGDESRIPVLKLKQLPAGNSICYEITREFNFSAAQTNEVMELLDAETGKYVESATHRIIRHRNMLIIAPKAPADTVIQVIEESSETVFFDDRKMCISIAIASDVNVSNDADTAFLDADKILFPLILRKRKQSDYFYPLGMRKKKKISRFLSDRKLSLVDKEKVWLIEMDKKLIWVVGFRIDERFKVTEATKRILRIQVFNTAF